ncbi:cobyric acid synthase [Aliikangiella sp. IMCC44653]
MAKGKLKGSLMIQGTTSDAGKSICVAGLCRLLKRQGVSVAPFKPQNMALNSAVTASGGEIGRAQALQAIACGLEPSTDFNPVLLKPSSDMRSQVIIHGQSVSDLEARSFGDIKQLAFHSVLESYARLQQQYDVILVEGAGSPAEINLRKNDIANMGFAEAVNCPVALIADINRGGVFAHLTGTLNLLSKTEQQRVKGLIINQFRGHLNLLQSGLNWLEQNTQKPVLGVLPFIPQLKLDAEDAIDAEQITQNPKINIKVLVLPRISNHTDFEPLKWHPQVNLEYVVAGGSLQGADLIIIPGSKSVRDDLRYIYEQGWHQQIQRHCRYSGKVLGICGGFQMLGELISDPYGVESKAGETKGLGLLDITTKLYSTKQLKQVTGQCLIGQYSQVDSQAGLTDASQHNVNFINKNNLDVNETNIEGYEIHCGKSKGLGLARPFAILRDQAKQSYSDGAVSQDNQVAGTYIHGLFESSQALLNILQWCRPAKYEPQDWTQIREQELDRLADVFERHLNVSQIEKIIG